MEFKGPQEPAFRGTKVGRIYLTTHRMIFNSKSSSDEMQSFSFPFITLSEVELEQPVFGANYIKGKVRAQPGGNWMGEAKFKLIFKSGGAIEFGQAMLKAAHMATRNANMNDPPPPYVPPTGQWYQAPPPAYTPPVQGYYGWVPPTQHFPQQPPTDGVFMTDAPPPYPGIAPQGQTGGGYGGGGGWPPQGGAGGVAPGGGGWMGGPQGGGGYPPMQGYPPQQGGYPPPQQTGGYPPQTGGFQQGANYPSPSGYPQFQGAAGGFPDAKAAEAAQSAYYDPNRPQMAYVPPPAYYETPPSYQDATHKKDQ